MMEKNHTIDWIAAFQSGSLEAVRELYRLHYASLQQFAELLIRDKAAAREIVIETLIKLINRRLHFQNDADIRAFLYITVRNAGLDCLNYWKSNPDAQKEQRENVYTEFSFNDDVDIDRPAATRLLLSAVEKLPRPQREVFRLVFVKGLQPVAVSKQLGMQPREVLLHRKNCIHQLEKVLSRHRLLSTPFLIHFLTVACRTDVRIPETVLK